MFSCQRIVLVSGSILAIMAASFVAPATFAANSWDGGGGSSWWFNPVNWGHDSGCPDANGICYLPPGQDTGGSLVRNDAQINTSPAGEGIVYDPVNDPFFAAAANLRYPTGSTLLGGSMLNRDYGPETLYRLYVTRNSTNSNTITIKSGDLAIENTTIIGRSGSTASTQNLGRVIQTGGSVRLPLIGMDLGQRETSGWGNGTYDYRGGVFEVSLEGTGALRLSHGSTTDGVGAGGVGKVIIHNPASGGGHISAWNVQSASYAGSATNTAFDPLDPDGITTGIGVFEFHFNNGGTRPMQVLNNLSINNGLDVATGGTRSSRLDLKLDAAPTLTAGVPQNLGLFDVDSDMDGLGIIQGTGDLSGTFSSANGATNYAQGATVSAQFGSTKYNWTISYQGNISWTDQANSVVSGIDGIGGRDIVLIGLSSESAGLAGDFNNNGKVDAADYTLWRNNKDTNNALLNDGGLGTPITTAHYNLWKTNFGMGTGGAGSVSAVPEPGTILMALLCVAGVVGLRRRVA